MGPVAGGYLGSPIRGWVWIKNLYIKKCPLELASLKPASSRAPSCEFAVACVNDSVVTGCRCGSMETLWNTLSRLPVR